MGNCIGCRIFMAVVVYIVMLGGTYGYAHNSGWCERQGRWWCDEKSVECVDNTCLLFSAVIWPVAVPMMIGDAAFRKE